MSSQFGAEPMVIYETALPPSDLVPKKLCSVVPWDLYITHWSMQGVLPAAASGAVGSVVVGPGVSKRDLGNNQHVAIVNISPRVMALDLMGLEAGRCDNRNRPKTGHSSSWWEMGVFVPEGDEPTEEEVAAANARLRTWCTERVIHGDNQYAMTKNAGAVDALAKKAARILKVDREWAQDLTEGSGGIDCPCCRGRIRAGAKKCVHCNELVGYDKAGKPYWMSEPRSPVQAEATKMGLPKV